VDAREPMMVERLKGDARTWRVCQNLPGLLLHARFWGINAAVWRGCLGRYQRDRRVSDTDGLVSVRAATYNERENIGELIERTLAAVQQPVRLIVVDDDSPDGTWQVVQAMARAGTAHPAAAAHGRAGPDLSPHGRIGLAQGGVVTWMDCDLSMPPRSCQRFWQRPARPT